MKIHYITVPMPHHASHSGYGRLLDFIPHSDLPLATKLRRVAKGEMAKAFADAKANVSWYEMGDLESEIRVNLLNPFWNRHVCHYLYGENSLFHTQRSRSNRKRIFVTFHQPPRYHTQFVRTRETLQNVDGVIVVGRNQIPFFSQFMDPSKVFFVPHGVDIDFFKPAEQGQAREKKNCLFVGNWLRDFETLADTARLLQDADPGITIDVLTLEKNRFHFNGVGNVNFMCGIPESDLLAKYQTSTVLLLPVRDCTANNTALEAMACGLPVITTDVGGIRDYVDDSCAVLCKPGDANAFAQAVLELLDDEGRRRKMGDHGRHRAQQFDWRIIAASLQDTYEQSFEKKVSAEGGATRIFSTCTSVSTGFDINYEAEVTVVAFPLEATAGDRIDVQVRIKNLSTTSWPAHVQKAVKLSYHVRHQDGSLCTWDGERTNLPFDVRPGDEIRVAAKVTTPSTPGSYKIEMDLVQEQVAWFSKKGAATPSFEIKLI